MTTKVVWFPAWTCQNYTFGESFGKKCPYCPYSLNIKTNRLIFDNKETSSDERADAQDLADFFNSNYEAMGGHLEISGGEALLREDIDAILCAIHHNWSITSNTLKSSVIEQMIASGSINRMLNWTASWHPCSGREAEYSKNIRRLAEVHKHARATVVISRQTIAALDETKKFLHSLPLLGINWHLDTHGTQDVSDLRAAADDVLGAGVVYLAGPPPQGKLCNRNSKLLAVGADGTLYPCVTFAYQNMQPICKVNKDVMIESLPQITEWCGEQCFACCDHIKHA